MIKFMVKYGKDILKILEIYDIIGKDGALF